MIDLARVIISLHPEAVWTLEGQSYEGLDWKDTTTPKPTIKQLQIESDRLEELDKANKYKQLRSLEYEKLNQFELQYNDQRDGTTTWIDAINEIKARYPKGE